MKFFLLLDRMVMNQSGSSGLFIGYIFKVSPIVFLKGLDVYER